jgi:hypothetical protein
MNLSGLIYFELPAKRLFEFCTFNFAFLHTVLFYLLSFEYCISNFYFEFEKNALGEFKNLPAE